MYVRNVAGYNFAFKYGDDNAIIHIPYDGIIYSIPDDSGPYRELKVIAPMNIRTQDVIYMNKNGQRASANISGHKRRGRPPKPVVEPKVNDTNSVVDVDLDADSITICVVNNDTDTFKEVMVDVVPQEKKRGRPRKEKTVDTAPKKKRGRPRKEKTDAKTKTPKKKRGRPRKEKTDTTQKKKSSIPRKTTKKIVMEDMYECI